MADKKNMIDDNELDSIVGGQSSLKQKITTSSIEQELIDQCLTAQKEMIDRYRATEQATYNTTTTLTDTLKKLAQKK